MKYINDQMKYLYYFMMSCLLLSCANGYDSKTTGDNSMLVQLNTHPLPELLRTDSIDLHFFEDAKTDSKKYKRIGINDTAIIHLLTSEEMKHPFATVSENCVYDTKLFCFGNGEIVKTLYLSTADSCRFIGFIKSGGVTVKMVLSGNGINVIDSLRSLANHHNLLQ